MTILADLVMAILLLDICGAGELDHFKQDFLLLGVHIMSSHAILQPNDGYLSQKHGEHQKNGYWQVRGRNIAQRWASMCPCTFSCESLGPETAEARGVVAPQNTFRGGF